MSEKNSGYHSKDLLQYPLIFVCKDRKHLVSNPQIIADCKRLTSEICSKHNVIINYMETDKDYIHDRMETTATIHFANFIGTRKSYLISMM